MVRIISTSSVPTSDGSGSRARSGAWQSGADGHALRAVPVDDEDHEAVLARRKAAARAEAHCVRGNTRKPAPPVSRSVPPTAINLFQQGE